MTVPNLQPFPAATVYHADAFAPDAVIPLVFPQHFAQEQYADVLKVLTVGVIPSTFFASVVEAVVAGFVVAILSDELLEVTPKSLRIRKRILDSRDRKRAAFRKS